MTEIISLDFVKMGYENYEGYMDNTPAEGPHFVCVAYIYVRIPILKKSVV